MQSKFICSRSKVETAEQCVKSVQSYDKDIEMMSLTLFWCIYC